MTDKRLASIWNALSIRARLAISYAATLTALLAVYAGLVFLIALQLFNAEVDRRLDQEVEIAERSLFNDASGVLVWRPPAVAADDYTTLANMLWVDVHRADGSLLHRQLGGYARGGPVEPLAFDPRRSGLFPASLPNGATLRVLQRTVIVSDGQKAVIRAALAEDQIRHDLSIFLLVLGGGLPFSVVAAGMAGYWLARRALVPIDRMIGDARSVTAEHLDARLPVVNANDELGRLAVTFNDMFFRLERSFGELKRFTADASHELRTPLSVIRSVGEVGLRNRHSEAEYRNVIGTMLEEADRLTQLTTLLLELSRAEGGRTTIKRELFDLRDLIRDAAELISVLAEEARVRIDLKLPDTPAPVSGDRTMLRQALINLIDNAIKHSPSDAVVSLAGRVKVDGVEIVVTDHGEGIPEEQLPRIFDRFYRVDAARNRERGGFGLGLAIVRWTVESHGGRIEVDSKPGQGSVFRITLPAAGNQFKS